MNNMLCACLCLLFAASLAGAAAKPLQTFTVKDYLRHQWTDEVIHFPVSYAGDLPSSLTLVDEQGSALPCQFTNLQRKRGTVTGAVWTVVSLPPKGSVTLRLQPGVPAPSDLRLVAHDDEYILGNSRMSLRLPRLATPAQPVDLTALPAPLLAVSDGGGKTWYGQGSWVNADVPLQVASAATTVLDNGPVRITVRYRLTLADGRFYQADISLGARQDAALFTDDTNIEAPKAAVRFAFQSGLNADRVYWRNNYFADAAKGLTPAPIDFSKEQALCNIRPWSFWWAKDLAVGAGFFKDGAEPFVAVAAVQPSRWMPYGWDGAERMQIPVTARPGGGLDVTLALNAWTAQHTDESKLSPILAVGFQYSQEALAHQNGTDSQLAVFPMHRELAITVGTVTEHVQKDFAKSKLRRQVVKYSEFPLDEVKDYAFDYTPARPERKHPFLLFTQADIDRVRRQAQNVPAVRDELAKVTKQITGAGGDAIYATRDKDPNWGTAFYEKAYKGGALGYGYSSMAFMGSADEKYGRMLAAAAKGMARDNVANIIDEPSRPCLGGLGHVYPGSWTNLLFAYDAVADSGYLTAEEKADIDASLVFGAHVLAHRDYWNTARGCCSANPNMTALIKLPRGLMALFLDGHPESSAWLRVAETELQAELKAWIAPGGAWIECPGYQGASLDPIFPLVQALKNVKGKNYFTAPQLKSTMEYYAFLITPPDKRFRLGPNDALPAPRMLPSFGDMWTGTVTVFPGWVAKAVADVDPSFSAHQQYAWNGMRHAYNTMYTMGYTPALTDPELPAAPPAVLSKGFPGFGSIMRTSWTDANASYVAHRTGPFLHHYHDDFNTIVYYAKGAPLCVDFGNLYAPLQRGESWYHSRVSFNTLAETPGQVDYSNGDLVDFRALPRVIAYSAGTATGASKSRDTRHLLMVQSDDPQGANYLVLRDVTTDGTPNQDYYWNLWCLSKEPAVAGNTVHFAGQLGVDLDVHLLAPAAPQITTDRWDWKQYIGNWGNFAEEQYGIHVKKQGSAEDFFAVLYPRAAGQAAAKIAAVANGRGLDITHMEGRDLLLLSAGMPADATAAGMRVSGEIAFARSYRDGAVRLAVLKGACTVTAGEWTLAGNAPTSLRVRGDAVTGECSGPAHAVTIIVPAAFGKPSVTLDGKPLKTAFANGTLTFKAPAGEHVFTIAGKR